LVGAMVASAITLGVHAMLVPGEDSALATRIARLEAAQRERRASPAPSTDVLEQRLARLEAAQAAPAAAPAGATDAALSGRLTALESEIKTLSDGAAPLNPRVHPPAEAQPDTAAQLARAPRAERRALDDAGRRIAALEASVKSLGERVGRVADQPGERALRAAVLALALSRAVERGGPYARELAALDPQFAGSERAALAPFADTGIPSAPLLARELLALIPAGRAATH